MINPLSPNNRPPPKDLLRRIDEVAAHLNVLLIVIAIGLAALDMTFLLTQTVINHLPPVSHGSYADLQPRAN